MRAEKICVMMSTFNGELFLEEQINSILNQNMVDVFLYIRDDGSNDGTIKLLKKYSSKSNVKVSLGHNIGVGYSFWELLKTAPTGYEFYAWSDQDDIWDKDKLYIATKAIKKMGQDKPLLYYSESKCVDKNLNQIKQNYKRNPSVTLGSALIRSNAQGATMLFNNTLRKLAATYTPDFKNIKILHDAWIHKLCLAVDGRVIYDADSHMSYRIHGNNAVAILPEKLTVVKQLRRKIKTKEANYCSDIAKELLKEYKKYIPASNMKLIYLLANYKNDFPMYIKLLLSRKISTGDYKEDLKFKLKVLKRRA